MRGREYHSNVRLWTLLRVNTNSNAIMIFLSIRLRLENVLLSQPARLLYFPTVATRCRDRYVT